MDQNKETGELPLLSAGQQLREAREAQKLTIDAISARTKIAARHLEAIEQDRFADLASRTYAIGFSRSYARALGLDEMRIADDVRAQIEADGDSRVEPHAENFEPGDPARVPPSLLAWGAGAAFIGVLIVLFLFWRSFVDPAGELPDLISDEDRAAQASANPATIPTEAAVAAGPVVISALEERVWVKIADKSGTQLFQTEMGPGETYTVPADAAGPVLSTARPLALRIAVGGRAVPPLSAEGAVLRNVPVDAASLLARFNPALPAASASSVAPRSAPVARTAPVPAAAPQPRRAPAAVPASPPQAAVPVTEPEPEAATSPEGAGDAAGQ